MKPHWRQRNPTISGNPLIVQLFELIDASGLTDYQICEKAGISNVALSQWRNTKRLPSLFTLQCVLGVLNYRIELCPIEQPQQSHSTIAPTASKSPDG